MSEKFRQPESWLKNIRVRSYQILGSLGVFAVLASCGVGTPKDQEQSNPQNVTQEVAEEEAEVQPTSTAVPTTLLEEAYAKLYYESIAEEDSARFRNGAETQDLSIVKGISLEDAYSKMYAEGMVAEDAAQFIRKSRLITKPTSTVVKNKQNSKPVSATIVKTTEPTKETVIPTSTPVVEVAETVEAVKYGFNPAKNEGNVWFLKDSDGNEVKKAIDAKGFIPDANLKVSDLSPAALGPIPADASDFQAYLNKDREGFGPLAGFTNGTNDYGQYGKTGPQVPAYSWMIHTGLSVEMPGIGKVTGEFGRAVMVLIINRTNDVYRFDNESVEVVAGFEGWGRIWNGDANYVQETDKRIVNHYRHRLGYGVAESGFIGQCDKGAENCDAVTVVTVERVQWGNNEDGTPRYQFRLIRAETVSAK